MILNKQYMSKNNKNKQRQALSIEEIYFFRGYLEKRFRKFHCEKMQHLKVQLLEKSSGNNGGNCNFQK